MTQKQLGAQFKAAGLNLGDYQRQIGRTSERLSALSAFHAVDLTKSFTVAFRATKRVSDALKIETVAAEAARGTGRDLAAVTLALSKAAAGSSGSLKRIGIVLPSTVKGMAAVAAVGERFAGQLTAGVTAQDRLNNALFNSKEIIGKALLPTVVSLADRLAAYLTKLNETGRLQKDVNKVIKDAGAIVHGTETALGPLVASFRDLSSALGGTKRTVEVLGAAWLGYRAILIGVASTQRIAALQALGGAEVGAAAGAGRLGAVLGRGGLAAQAGLASFAITSLTLKATGLDKVLARAGGGLEDLLSKSHGARIVLGLPGPVDAGPSADASKAVAQAVRMIGRGLSAKRIEATLKLRFHLNQHDFDILFADARRRIAAGLSIPQAVADSPGRDPGRFQTAGGAADPTGARRRAPLSLQGRFNLLQLALAKAELTSTKKDDRAILVQEAAIVKQMAEKSKVLKDRTALYQQLAQIDQQIAGIDQAAAQKQAEARAKAAARAKKAREAAKKAAEKAAQAAATFTIPARLQLAEARAEAFAALHPTVSGGPTALELNIARRIKTAALKALASGKKTIQGQIDAWNAITAANQTLSQAAKAATGTRFHKASANALISQYGLSGDAARALRASLAGIGPGGTVAGSGSGAFGYATHVDVTLDGQKVARSVTVHQDRTRRRNPAAKRGPNAGR